MMRKIFVGMFCVALCLAIGFIFPQLGGSWSTVDEDAGAGGCLDCHDKGSPGVEEDTIHGHHPAASCEQCHVVTGDTPASSKCIVCHPLTGGTGQCPLVNFHDPDKGADCLGCHPTCEEETTTTTSTDETSTTTTTDETSTTTTAEETSTTTTTDETSTTTTVTGTASCTVTPDPMLRSNLIWLPVIPWVTITGDGTNFANFSTKVSYSPSTAMITIIPPLILGAETIWQPAIVNPAWAANVTGDETVTATVTTDSETVECDFEIELLDILSLDE